MRNIHSDTIIDFLNSNEFRYEWVNPREGQYSIASIFEPMDQGFYFYSGQNIPEEIGNSLILIEKEKLPHKQNTKNSLLVVEQDPQLIFYGLLSDVFARVSTGIVSPTAVIHPEAIVGKNVQIDHFCVIGNCKIEDNCIIGSHTVINDDSEIGRGSTVETHSAIGTQGVAWVWNEAQSEKIIPPQLGGVKIGEACFLGANTIVVRGSLNESTEIGQQTLIAPGARIGHGTKIGAFVHFANNVITGGNTCIGDHCFVGSGAVFRPKVVMHDFTIVGAGAVVIRDTTKPGLTLTGLPATETVSKVHPSGMPKQKTNPEAVKI